MNRETLLLNMYQAMFDALGPSHWWPGSSAFEVAVGAILTQNCAWRNVEKAIANLKEAGVLQPQVLHELDVERLAELIRPAGYFRVKARRLHNFLHFLRDEAGFSIEALKAQATHEGGVGQLREKLMAVKGIGPETADAICCYALELPTFVVDAYTHRLLTRHYLVSEDAGYEDMREFFMDVLPEDVALYNEYHALIVRVGHTWCKKKRADCARCPLGPFLE